MSKPATRTPQCPQCGWPIRPRHQRDGVPAGKCECGRCRTLVEAHRLEAVGGERR